MTFAMVGRLRRDVRGGPDRATAVAAAVAVAALVLAGTEVAVYLSHPPPPRNREMALVELWQYVLQGASMTIASFLIIARRRTPVLGWILLAGAFAFALAACLSTWLRFATAVTGPVRLAVYAEYALWQMPRLAFVLIPLFFPDGKLPGRRARWLAVAVAGAIVVDEVSDLLDLEVWHPGGTALANALLWPAWQPVADGMRPFLEAAAYAGVVAVAFSPLTRWRRADAVARRRIAIGVPVFVLMVAEEGLRLLFFWSGPVAVARIAITVAWPAMIAYLVVRDGLHELDLAARRVVAVVVPVTVLLAVYAGAAASLSILLPGASPALATALAVLGALVGLVLRPIGQNVSSRVDRLLYGDRARPYQAARRLAAKLRDSADPAQVPVAVCQIVVNGLRLPGAALDATTGDGERRLAAVGSLSGPAAEPGSVSGPGAEPGSLSGSAAEPGSVAGVRAEPVELRHQGRSVGRLLVSPRAGQDRLDDLDRAALRPLADLAAPAVSALRLQEELAASHALVATARERAVSAREEERRRLRRDVHDGVGPSLAAIRLRVDTAAALLPADSPSGELLTDVSWELQEIVAEMRRITRDQPPPALEWCGLPAALAELAERLSSPVLPVELDLPGDLPALAPAVATALYRIAAEALANAVRHSGATRAILRVVADANAVTLTIRDNGTGIAARVPDGGVGLPSMRQRAAEVGGECRVDGTGPGTVVTARMPVPSR